LLIALRDHGHKTIEIPIIDSEMPPITFFVGLESQRKQNLKNYPEVVCAIIAIAIAIATAMSYVCIIVR
jgi:hypothetical protein